MSDAVNLAPATWIWDPRLPGHHAWLRAEHDLALDAAQAAGACLLITASTQYELRVNSAIAFRGPAKSARGRVSVDRVQLGGLLRSGANRLAITVHHVGVPTMTWCQARPGLVFRLDAADGTVLAASGPATRVAPDPAHAQATVRRWAMPCIEALDLAAGAPAWAPGTPCDPGLAPYLRRVPPPSRRRRTPQRFLAAQTVAPPTLVLSQRLKPYLCDAAAQARFNHFDAAALLVTEIDSPVAQELRFLPAMGAVSWFLDGRLLFDGSGWAFDRMLDLPPVAISAGRSRLLGLNRNSHFEDITLALRASTTPVRVANPYGAGWVQVVRLPGERSPATPAGLDPDALRHAMPAMDPADGGPDRNAFVRVMDAAVEGVLPIPAGDAAGAFELPAPPSGRATRLVLDFGWVVNGHLALRLDGAGPGRLTAAWTEHAIADGAGGLRLQWPCCNNAVAIRTPGGAHEVEAFQAHGGRHLVLDWEGAAPLRLSQVAMLDANCGSAEAGTLATDRPLHADIWDICQRSVVSGVDDTFTDCPTFEQVCWNFDNHTAWLGERWLCANQAVAANSLRLFAEDPLLPGLVRSQYPSDWDNFIPLWSFHWIEWVRDHWFHTGDAATARALLPRVAAGLDEALGRCRDDGLMAWDGVWHFVEWADGRDDGHAVNACEQGGLWSALRAGEELAEGLGETAAAARWRAARARLGEAIERRLWLPERGAWADSLHADGTPSPISTQVTSAWLAACGLGGDERARAIARRIVANDPALLPYGSPLGLYRILELLCRSGEHAAALAIIERRWGEMLADGDRTVWETFPEFGLANGGWATRSRCHPFAAYAAGMLVRILLGLEVVEPGCRRIRLRAPVAAAGARAQAVLPTPLGRLAVAWTRRADGGCAWQVEAPAGMAVENG